MEWNHIKEIIILILHPTKQDFITAIFDLIFVCSGIQNVRLLIKDKEVKGFDWKNMVLFALWNIWTILFIYPEAALYLANAINCVYFILQIVWLSLFLKYRRNNLNNQKQIEHST